MCIEYMSEATRLVMKHMLNSIFDLNDNFRNRKDLLGFGIKDPPS